MIRPRSPRLAMRHEDNLMSGGITYRDLPFSPTGAIWIEEHQGQRIEEYRYFLIKGYVVFLNIGLGLRRVPLIDHSLT